jgi:predicted CopG family antitoxin
MRITRSSVKMPYDSLKGNIYLLTILTILFMLATKRIPVTEAVWVELSDLKTAGQTYSQLLEEMIEDRKKARFFRDMEKIEEEGEFVEFPW